MLLNHLCIRLNLIFIVFSPNLSTVSVDKKIVLFLVDEFMQFLGKNYPFRDKKKLL